MTDIAPGALALDEQICFALYSASRALTARYRDLLSPLGVTYPQYLVLQLLWGGGATTVGDLGKALHLDSGTLSPLLRRLEQAGLIAKSRPFDDERIVEIGLTREGEALKDRASGIPVEICAATGLELDDLGALTAQIGRLANHVRALT